MVASYSYLITYYEILLPAFETFALSSVKSSWRQGIRNVGCPPALWGHKSQEKCVGPQLSCLQWQGVDERGSVNSAKSQNDAIHETEFINRIPR